MDPLDDNVAAAVEGLDTPAPTGFGYVVPSLRWNLEALLPGLVDSFSAPPCGVQWHAATSYSTVYASASLSSGASNLLSSLAQGCP